MLHKISDTPRILKRAEELKQDVEINIFDDHIDYFSQLEPVKTLMPIWLTNEQVHLMNLIQASLQYCFFLGTDELKPFKSNDINDLVLEAFEKDKGITWIEDKLPETDITLLDKRIESLNELRPILETYPMHWNNPQASYDLLMRLPLFKRDVFFKKGILAIQSSARMFGYQTDLPIPADYRIPQVLHKLGILEYPDRIMNKIENSEIFPENSKDELAIRAASILACYEIQKKANITAETLDFVLFQMIDSLKHHHLCITRNSLKHHHLCVTTNY